SFRTDHLVTTAVHLPTNDYSESGKRSRFYNSILTVLGALPGVEGVALSSNPPLSGGNSDVVTIAGKPAPTTEIGDVGIEQVSENFLSVIGIPLLRGRQFDSRDHENATQVAIINQRFAAEYLPNEDPIGKQIKLGRPNSESPWVTIVGLAGNVERGDFFK